MRARRAAARAAFTLMELLTTVGVLAVLALGLVAVTGPTHGGNPRRARTRAQLRAVEAALAMYEGDVGRLPRSTARVEPDVMFDDAPALCAALLFHPSAGGGPSGPYLHWQPLGLLDQVHTRPALMGQDGVTGVTALADVARESAREPVFQRAHGPGQPLRLVLLDPWGGPLHYREWASVPSKVVRSLEALPHRRAVLCDLDGDSPLLDVVDDAPVGRYQVWSNGPNGVNEFGQGDDVGTWSDG